VGAVRAFLGLSLLQQYPTIASRRNRNAEYVLNKLQNLSWGEIRKVSSDIQPMYLRVNVFAGGLSTWQVDYVAAMLCQAGFRAGRFNWSFSLDQVPHLSRRVRDSSPLSNARNMAGHCLNLPVHQNMDQSDLDRMIDILWSMKV
jgi:dTDP-4-amino-4,6-dideoxygalactose transaminase